MYICGRGVTVCSHILLLSSVLYIYIPNVVSRIVSHIILLMAQEIFKLFYTLVINSSSDTAFILIGTTKYYIRYKTFCTQWPRCFRTHRWSINIIISSSGLLNVPSFRLFIAEKLIDFTVAKLDLAKLSISCRQYKIIEYLRQLEDALTMYVFLPCNQ